VSPQNSSGRKRSEGRTVYAAGAVLWRPANTKSAKGAKDARDALEIAVIHRPRYDDWSLPKGKVDRGETAPVAAAREVLEETGHHGVLGRRLDTVCYPIDSPSGGVKKVYYWAARSTGGEFTSGNEVDELIWLPVADAMKKLQYAQDRKILRLFAKHPADTHTMLVVRHGTAGSKARYSGDDTERPLDKKGRAQAEALVAQLLAFGATDVHAADRVRCYQTVEPLAEELGVRIRNEPTLTEEAYTKNPKRSRNRALQIAGRSGTPVICSQGKVIPDLIGWWCERDGIRPDKSRNHKGSTWVLSLAAGRLVAADHIGGALAANVRA
jgi:8-oxo-dGTP pyrophosphatase MutT (NUDIX family)/phosphohistidine phosphatase SixA